MTKNLDELPALVKVGDVLTLRDYIADNCSDGDIADTQHNYNELHHRPLTRVQARYEFADIMLKQRGSHA